MRFHRSLVVVMFVSLASIQTALADNQKDETVVLKSSIEKDAAPSCIGACHINFPKALGLPLEYLDSIGHQIHAARKAPDPVGLALAARGLAVAEQVSEKKAKVTSQQVMEEAVLLTKLRGKSAELKAVAQLVSDKATQKELAGLADAAADREADDREAAEKGEASKALHGTLQVVNHTHETLRIYVDGNYVGWVYPHQTYNFHVHAHHFHNHFDAYCATGGELVKHANYTGYTNFLPWHIYH